jgi:3-(3-hydroxy-phenyl)propionate hydroxylase
MKRRQDRVVVAGGGPVGSLAALLLARSGIPIVLLEREAGMQPDYRASTFHPPTLDLLEECGAEAALLRMGLRCDASQFRDRRRGRIAEFDFGALKRDTRHPFRLQCEQFKLVDWLYAELRRIPGVELLFETSFCALTANEDGVAVQVESAEGRRTLNCDFLIGADASPTRSIFSSPARATISRPACPTSARSTTPRIR